MRDWLNEGDDPDDIDDDDNGAESLDDIANMEHVYELWIAHNKLCNCGGPITFDEAYYDGVCAVCYQREHQQVVPF